MVHKSDPGSSALEASTFGGRMPAGSGDMAIEAINRRVLGEIGIAPLPKWPVI